MPVRLSPPHPAPPFDELRASRGHPSPAHGQSALTGEGAAWDAVAQPPSPPVPGGEGAGELTLAREGAWGVRPGCRAERLQTQASNTKQASPRHSVISQSRKHESLRHSIMSRSMKYEPPRHSIMSQSMKHEPPRHSIMSQSMKHESPRHNGASPRGKRHPRKRTNQQQRRGPPFQRRSCSARNHAAAESGLPSPAWCVSQWCK